MGNSLLEAPAATAEDEKRARVLDCASKVVLTYGFQRTTMDDIARAADMSRPALYLLFKNKTEIYRAVAGRHMRASADQARAALAREGPLETLLMAALEPLIALTAAFAASPHGPELLDMKNSLAGDIVESWREEMTALTAAAIGRAAQAAGADLTARDLSAQALARLFWDGIEGMKARVHEPEAQRQAARVLANVLGRMVAA